MRYRALGKTGLKLSEIGFGGAPIGGIFGPVIDEEVQEMFHKAIASGINYFDTSPFYGKLSSEIRFGKCLKTIPRDKYIISTKCGRYAIREGNHESTFDFSTERVTKSIDESMERLQLDYIDIVFCHDVEFADREQVINEGLPALYKLKQSGKIGFIGISGLPLKVLEGIMRDTKVPIDVVLSYCHDSLHADQFRTCAARWKEQYGVALISAAPFSMGMFTPGGPPDWHPATGAVKEAVTRANLYCKMKGVNIAQLAVQHCMGNEEAASLLCGFNKMWQLDQCLEAYNSDINKEVHETVLKIMEPVKNIMWAHAAEEEDDETQKSKL